MQCDSNPVTLGAYLDGELPPDQVTAVREHIGSCPRCAAEIAELARLQRSLRPAREYFAPSAEFRRSIQQQIAAPRRRPWSLRLIPAAIAVAAVLLTAFVWIGYSHRSDAFAEMADLHVNALASTNLVDVVSTDRHTVKPWFQGKIPFSFNLPEFSGTEYTLLGGRLVYFHQTPGAQLIVAMRQHKISVLIFQESPEMARAFSGSTGVRHRNSFGIETWESQGLRFVIISDAEPAGIDKLAASLKQANQ
ncbi:MAG TPA: zf-HC2 domain-containing protein [Silvibacterium sp.]|nr:zf-HC2 domain-containing protein [Silvibacterium sp.]